MDKFKALSLVLLGMVIGLGYAVACGSGGSDDASMMPGGMTLPGEVTIPGVDMAMAQSGCTGWEVVEMNIDELGVTGTQTSATGEAGVDIFAIPTGWTPLTGVQNNIVWLTRCAQ